MIKFIFKTFFFIIPVLIIYLSNFFIKYESVGDLTRIGNLHFDNKFTKNLLSKEGNVKIKYFDYTKTKINEKFSILTIGDSFNNQNEFGYNNYLAHYSNFKVLHYDGPIKNNNPIQTLIGLINGNFFELNKVQFVLLENIERHIIENSLNLDFNFKLDRNQIIDLKNNNKTILPSTLFLKNTSLKISLNTLKYFITNQTVFNKKVYRVSLTDNFFTVNDNSLLFYFYDLNSIKINNNLLKVMNLNNILNNISYKLNKKGIKLIFLACPDKYDFYYDFIENKESYHKPIFFDLFKKLRHDFIFIDSKNILMNNITLYKDLYFYEDTHWSPNSTKLIAKEINKTILLN